VREETSALCAAVTAVREETSALCAALTAVREEMESVIKEVGVCRTRR